MTLFDDHGENIQIRQKIKASRLRRKIKNEFSIYIL